MKIRILVFSFLLVFISCTNKKLSDDTIVDAIIREDWALLYEVCNKNDSLLEKTETIALMGHAAIMLNKNNTSFILLKSIDIDSTKTNNWLYWADSFAQDYPNNAVANYFLGDAKMRNGYKEEALKYFNKAIDIDNNFALAFNARGVIYTLFNDKNNAMEDLNKACKLAPKISNFYANKAYMKYKIRAPEGAYSDYENALKLSPTFAMALNGKACSMLYNNTISISDKCRMDTISFYLSAAINQIKLPVFNENMRLFIFELENSIAPDQIESPYFKVSDFLDWEALKQHTIYDKFDLFRYFLKIPLPEIIDYATLLKMNLLLEEEDLFKSYLREKDLPDSLISIINMNNSSINRLGKTQKEKIIFTNRIIFENYYNELIASFQNRDVGTTLRSSTSLAEKVETFARGIRNGAENAPTFMLDKVSVGIPGTKMETNLYELITTAANAGATIAEAGAIGFQIYDAHKSIGNQKKDMIGLQENNPTTFTNPAKAGGAIADIMRGSIDNNKPFTLVCLNGLGYE